jgi:hypothetical protein
MFDPIGMAKRLEDEATEEFLDILLEMMKWYYLIYPQYTKNFTGSYWFKDKDGKVSILVKFHDGEMEISKDPHPDPKPYPETTVMVTFKDSNALQRFLLAVKKDILRVVLNNEIQVTGNLNYLYKFVFMANHPIHGLLNLENKLT